jgi:ArsR family transcriptional regulator, virulence genes transcriptional regulator
MTDVRAATMSDFAEKATEASNLLRELANEKRLLILCALMDRTEMSVNELADKVGLSQSALSQHLARLRERNLVRFRREGASLFYSVSSGDVGRILKTLKSIYC